MTEKINAIILKEYYIYVVRSSTPIDLTKFVLKKEITELSPITPTQKTFQDIIGAIKITKTTVTIEEKNYTFIFNLEAETSQYPTLRRRFGPYLFGTLIIAGPPDEKNNLTSLNEEDLININRHIRISKNSANGVFYRVLTEN